MRPLPRLHAITDERVLRLDDLGVRASAIAAAGSAVALHARGPSLGGAALLGVAERFAALAWPAEAALVVNGRADIALAAGAQGVQLGRRDLLPSDARPMVPAGWIGVSVHSEDEARQAADEGADYLLAGAVFATASHPGAPAQGLALIEAAARTGLPVIAIGGITADTAGQAAGAGAWGVAAIRALWDAARPGDAALALLAPWLDGAADA